MMVWRGVVVKGVGSRVEDAVVVHRGPLVLREKKTRAKVESWEEWCCKVRQYSHLIQTVKTG